MLAFKYTIGPDVRLTFSDKPDARVRGMLKASGFRWSPSAGLWWRNRVSGAADFVAALQSAIDRAAGIRKPNGTCWVCNAQPGYFRTEGPFTPVRCDECHRAAVQQQVRAATGTAMDRFDRDYEDGCRDRCGL